MTGSSGMDGAWAARLAAPQLRSPKAVAATRKLWDAAYPKEPFDADLEALSTGRRGMDSAGLDKSPHRGQGLCRSPHTVIALRVGASCMWRHHWR